jgi:threonine dehydratase
VENDMCQCSSDFYSYGLTLADVNRAGVRIQPYVKRTSFERNERLSSELKQNILLKREDRQVVRSFKLRGALNKLLSLSEDERQLGVVCASAGNHAQGLAYACRLLNAHCVIFLPKKTPKQKVEQVQYFGNRWVEVILFGQNFDECCNQARIFAQKNGGNFVHPFDDLSVIAGQGTMALEMIGDLKESLDYLFVPVGGGGLISGVSMVFKSLSPKTKVIGVEVDGSAGMSVSLLNQERTSLKELDSFADGTAVKLVGKNTFEFVKRYVDDVFTVTKKDVSEMLINLYNHHGIVVEPSGALSLAAVSQLACKNANVGCIVSGGNNDSSRFSEYHALLSA